MVVRFAVNEALHIVAFKFKVGHRYWVQLQSEKQMF